MVRPNTFLALALICCIWLSASGLRAERPAPIQLGMTLYQVVSLLGAPLEKIEYESSRSERWHYAHGSLLFRSGRVVLMDAGMGKNAETSLLSQNSQPSVKSQLSSVSMFALRDRDKEMHGVLDEIMREIPAGDDSESKPGGATPPGGAALDVPPVKVFRNKNPQ